MTGSLLGHATIDIDASADRVWTALTDFSRYHEWNAFTPRIDAEPRVGAPVHIHVDMGFARMVEKGRVVELEPGGLIRWHVFPMPRLLAWGDRVQRVEPLGQGKCRYSSEDRLRGLLAPLVALIMRGRVTRGFATAAAGLKRFVEAA
jgi:hypothetical protein